MADTVANERSIIQTTQLFIYFCLFCFHIAHSQTASQIECSTTSGCASTTIDPTSNDADLNVICSASSACEDATINAPTNGNLYVECSEGFACRGTTIYGPTYGDLTVNCVGSNVCPLIVMDGTNMLSGTVTWTTGADSDGYGNAKIYCPGNNNDCFINCDATAACTRTEIYTQTDTQTMTVSLQGTKAMHWANIYCESGPNSCLIDIIGEDINPIEASNIYSVDGYNDVKISCHHSDTNTCINSADPVTMYCLSDQSAVCSMFVNSNGFGDCSDADVAVLCNAQVVDTSSDPTKSPTLPPTQYPTQYPTLYPTKYPTVNPSELPTNYPSKSPVKDGEVKFDTTESGNDNGNKQQEPADDFEDESVDQTLLRAVLLIAAMLGVFCVLLCILACILRSYKKQSTEVSEINDMMAKDLPAEGTVHGIVEGRHASIPGSDMIVAPAVNVAGLQMDQMGNNNVTDDNGNGYGERDETVSKSGDSWDDGDNNNDGVSPYMTPGYDVDAVEPAKDVNAVAEDKQSEEKVQDVNPVKDKQSEEKIQDVHPVVEDKQSEVEDVEMVCADCGLAKDGKVFDTDELFYCFDCWNCYEE